jgi:PAS domain S-box-containing protein
MSSSDQDAGAVPLSDADLLHVLLEQLPDAMYFKDALGRYVRINRTLASWYGLESPDDAVGKTEADFFSPELAKANRQAEEEILKTGLPQVDVEEKVVWPGGRVTLASASRLPLRDASGAVVGTFGIFRDIGPHHVARKEIRNAESSYRSLVDSLPQNFFRKDLEGRVTFANREYCKTVGRSLKELLGKTDFDLFPVKMAQKYVEDDKRVVQTGIALDTVEAHQPPGKGTIFVRVVKTPVYDAEQRAVGVQGIFWEVPAENKAASGKARAAAPAKKKPAKKKPAKPRARKK